MADSGSSRGPGLRQTGAGISVGKVWGIPVLISPSWLIIAAYITVVQAPLVERTVPGIGAASYAVSLSFALLLLLSVLAHELGHCLASKGLGLPVRGVTIFLLYGVSEIEEEPQTPAREYLVAIAGPLVSLVLATAGAAALPLFDSGSVSRAMVSYLAVANAVVTVFNLLPGLPLDGGRVLRAGVWQLSKDKLTGTKAAAYAGRGVAVLVVLAAVGPLPYLGYRVDLLWLLVALLTAGFIWAGATQSLRGAVTASRLPRVNLRTLARRAIPVTADLPLAEALRRARDAGARGLVVLDGSGRPDGVVSEAAVLATPEQRRPWIAVGTLARRLGPGLTLDADLTGAGVLDAMRAAPASEYLVVEKGGAVVGILASADVARVLGTRT